MSIAQIPSKRRIGTAVTAFLSAAVALPVTALAQDAPMDKPGIVSHIKVVSDKVEDVSSLEAWKNSFIKEGMTDEEKGLAIFDTVVKFRHQHNPPNEFLQTDRHPHDAIRQFNVYGYNQCCCASAHIQELARYIGMESQGRIISHHSVPEVKWGGRWRMLDASLINYFRTPDGEIAGVQEIRDSVEAWEKANPDFDMSDENLRIHSRSEAFRENGPEIFKNSEFLGVRGWFPAKTHGWYSIVTAYDGKAWGVFEYGYSQGYKVNVQLRPGERITRNWFHRGMHVNMLERPNVHVMESEVGKGDLVYSPDYGDIAPGRLGNGTIEYDVPLADGTFRKGALVAENLVSRSERISRDATHRGGQQTDPAIQVEDASQPAILVLRMPSSYIYLGGMVNLDAVIPSGGSIRVELSDNNGLDWKEVSTITAPGRHELDLKPLIFRRYDYRLKLTLTGQGTGLESLKIVNDIQHSQRPLPALAQGENTITFTAGPQEGTITIEGSTKHLEEKKNLTYLDFHPQVSNIASPGLSVTGSQGEITFPISTSGDMTRIRMGAFFRTRDPGDRWEMQVSFDGGRTFRTIGRLAQPGEGSSHYVTFDQVPPGTREALVRYAGARQSEATIWDFRIDADYEEPTGGFAPVRVTYVWEENGEEKRHAHTARSPQETYTIHVAEKPLLKSLIVELD